MNDTILDDNTEKEPLDAFKPKFWWKYYLLIASNAITAIFLNTFFIIGLLLTIDVMMYNDLRELEQSFFGQFCMFFTNKLFGGGHFTLGMLFLGGCGYTLQHIFYILLSVQTKKALQNYPTWKSKGSNNGKLFWFLSFCGIVTLFSLLFNSPSTTDNTIFVLCLIAIFSLNLQILTSIYFFRKLHKNLF